MGADLVIAGGRVIDPLSGFDAVADVVLEGGRVSALGSAGDAPVRVDASGLVVAPGFIDIHSHVHSIAGQRLQAHDGVTTCLDLEAGLSPVAAAYRVAGEAGRPLNYGFSASWAALRMHLLAEVPLEGSIEQLLHGLGQAAWQREATAREQERLLELLAGELAEGAIGVGVLAGYAPGTAPDEYIAVAAAAARAGLPVFTHARELVEADPDVRIDGPTEIVKAAAETGAHMHCCHINSTSRRHIDRVLALVERATAEGAHVTTEAYPYGSGSTAIGAAFLDPDLLHRMQLKPSSLVYLPTGERVPDAARLRQLRAEDPGGLCLVEFFDETDPKDLALLDRSLLGAESMVASDAMPLVHGGRPTETSTWPLPPSFVTHPRTAGTFCRVLRRHVREQGSLDLVEAIRRCSTLPALLLQGSCPAMARKGRLQAGSDADIVVFDPQTVSDQATYLESTRPSTGVSHLFVNGVAVIRDGLLDPEAMPGRPVRAG